MGSLALSSDAPEFEPALLQYPLGMVDYALGREFQESLVAERILGAGSDALIFGEHPHVVTLGRNCSDSDFQAERASLEAANIAIVRTNRGGKATYHGPGQLVVYPVISLRERNLGVRRFVSLGLEAIAAAVASFELRPRVEISEPGVWVGERKLASVGLSISGGVTNHGFSLNVSNSLEYARLFSPCGLEPRRISTLEQECGAPVEMEQVSARVYSEFAARLGVVRKRTNDTQRDVYVR
jgi:lipoate-protein ligase B